MSATAILLKTKDKPVADKFTAFIKSLSDEEKIQCYILLKVLILRDSWNYKLTKIQLNR